MKFSARRNSLILSLSLGCILFPAIAMDSAPQSPEIKSALSLAQNFHQQTHKDQQFGYVKFDLKLDDKNYITPWVILPEDWIPAFNGHLHGYYPEINSEVYIRPKQATTPPTLYEFARSIFPATPYSSIRKRIGFM
jgi:hypothetical protein